MFTNLLKKFQPFFYRMIKWYYRKERTIHIRNIEIRLNPGVFHPGLYLSTDLFLNYLLQLNLNNKSVLELGCGSAFIIMYLKKHRNIEAYASDINPAAIEGLKVNSRKNKVDIKYFVSDLFDNIPSTKFDYILINPPYFNGEIKSMDEFAFFTGKDFAYFKKLFNQLKSNVRETTNVLMILSANVDLTSIEEMAKANTLTLNQIHSDSKLGEKFLIFKLVSTG